MTDLIGSPRSEFVGGRIEELPAGTVVGVDTGSSYPFVVDGGAGEGGAGEGGAGEGGTAEGGAAAYVAALDLPDEDESVSVDLETEATELPDDIVYELAIGAATHGREFDGRLFAELLEQGGPIEDVRLMIAIAVLRTGQKLNGDRMLRVLEELGFSGEATAARLARDAIIEAGGAVKVESVGGPVPGVDGVGVEA